MSGWIKLDKDLLTDPRFKRASRMLVARRSATALQGETLLLGSLALLWLHADSHLRDDDTFDMGAEEVDQLVGVDGFCSVLPTDWLQIIDAHSIKLPNFHVHNGTEAKKRAQTQKRVERHRTKVKRTDDTSANATALPDQTKTRPTPDQTTKKDAHAARLPLSVPGLDPQAWDRWSKYRTAIKKPIKPASIEEAQRALAAFGADQAAVVAQSIAHSWQGLFAIKANGRTPAASQPAIHLRTAEEIEAEERTHAVG